MSITEYDQRGTLCDKKVPVKLKNKLYKIVIRPTLIHGSECWALHKAGQQRMHTTEMTILRRIHGKTRIDRIRNEKFRSDAINTYVAQKRLSWYGHVRRRHKCCTASNNDEDGREEFSRKAQTEVDGQSAERFETTPAQSKARTEPRSMEKGSHGDRPRIG